MVVQAGAATRARRAGREADERRAHVILDELLDHWRHADVRAASRAIEQAEALRSP